MSTCVFWQTSSTKEVSSSLEHAPFGHGLGEKNGELSGARATPVKTNVKKMFWAGQKLHFAYKSLPPPPEHTHTICVEQVLSEEGFEAMFNFDSCYTSSSLMNKAGSKQNHVSQNTPVVFQQLTKTRSTRKGRTK